MGEGPPIGRYEAIDYQGPEPVVRPYDPHAPEVAARVARLIRGQMPDAVVEHIGSTAVPGCDGKGIIDLMLLYPPGRLSEARDAVDALGFQPQTGPHAFPEERPMGLGAITHAAKVFRLHVHILAVDAAEAGDLRRLRDLLRADPALVAAYVSRKRAVVAGGAIDRLAYNQGKEALILELLNRTTP